jgi:signal-transduction protein with cAMP-binding, CBS, and nucleotidyltransferase domain
MPADYKDLKRMVMELDFFKKPRNGEQYGEEEAMELVRHIKLKYFPPKKHIYFPEQYSHECYFILRGKVAIGVHSDMDRNKALFNEKQAETKKKKSSVPTSLDSRRSSYSRHKNKAEGLDENEKK